MKRFVGKGWAASMITVFFMLGMASSALAAGPAQKNLILATTTSTQDSGLLDVLIPVF